MKNPITSMKSYFSGKLDDFYAKSLCPDRHRMAWFMQDLMKATPNRRTWNRFMFDQEFDLLRYAGEDIAILSDDYNAVMLYDQDYIKSLTLSFPEKFLDLSNHILQVAYLAAYYYPVSWNTPTQVNIDIKHIQSKQGIVSYNYDFNQLGCLEINNEKRHHLNSNTLIFKRQSKPDIFIHKFSIRSFYSYQYAVVHIGFDGDNLYYNFRAKDDPNVFTTCPINVDEIMQKLQVVSKDELFKLVSTDIISFIRGEPQDDVPTYRDKLLIDMTLI